MTDRNTTPATEWQALRRLLNCNKQQLAQRLGVSARTLRNWEAASDAGHEPGKDASQKASLLLITTLRAARHADVLAQWVINWDAISTVGGRK